MSVTCIIQARLNSSRLPGKVLKRIEGKTMLERVVERVRLASEIERVVVATPDEAITEECDRLGVEWFIGPEADVLNRYLECAEYFERLDGKPCDPIVRVTADCPLIDPGILNALVTTYKANPGSFVTNNLEPTFPHGLDAEVFSRDMLRQAHEQATDAYDREHVSPWMRRQPGAINLRSPEDLSHFRITVDTADDMTLMRAIYRALGSQPYIKTADVVDLICRRPELAALGIKRRAA